MPRILLKMLEPKQKQALLLSRTFRTPATWEVFNCTSSHYRLTSSATFSTSITMGVMIHFEHFFSDSFANCRKSHLELKRPTDHWFYALTTVIYICKFFIKKVRVIYNNSFTLSLISLRAKNCAVLLFILMTDLKAFYHRLSKINTPIHDMTFIQG